MGVKTNPWAAGDIPASLLRRLGEAADGFRGSSNAYYVVALEPDADGHHQVFGPYPTTMSSLPDETSTGEWGWFGPVRTSASPPSYTIDKIDIGTTMPSTVHLIGRDYDSLFYSLSAVEKFAVPYYARMYGGTYVTKLLSSFRTSNLHLMVHLPGTEYELKAARRVEPATEEPYPPGIAAVIRVKETGAIKKAVIEPILPEPAPASL